ncbi:hypothetical protein SteCoe_15814 [Stentor coeruleus]|uniref:Rab-GAP TBC domain-containing protein n=1 Tax=Stentor coeruleus TaxID=5963 RepID=A0A1R2C2U1_9CILI|nr:hypothetical protein SteCoe_15814 [Stentor coeruleus]
MLRDVILNSSDEFYLRLAAISDMGLVDGEIRKTAWPILLKVDNVEWEIEDARNKNSEIIEMDVLRSISGNDIANRFSEDERRTKRKELSKILNTIIKTNPTLNYYQGFNHICTVFLITSGLNIGYHLSENCALNLLKDAMRNNFEQGLIQQISLIYDLLDKKDPIVARKLESIYAYNGEVEAPIICLSWVLCWFSNNLKSFKSISRIFDFCIATHALAPIYLSAIIFIWKKPKLLDCQNNYEFYELFKNLDDINCDKLCQEAFELMIIFPPWELLAKHYNKFKSDSPVFEHSWLMKILSRKIRERKLGHFITGFLLVTSVLVAIKL